MVERVSQALGLEVQERSIQGTVGTSGVRVPNKREQDFLRMGELGQVLVRGTNDFLVAGDKAAREQGRVDALVGRADPGAKPSSRGRTTKV